MAIYGVTIKGRNKRLLVKAESAAKAVALFVEAKALTAEQMQDALDEGESVWKPDQPLPEDGPATVAAAEAKSEAPADPPADPPPPAGKAGAKAD